MCKAKLTNTLSVLLRIVEQREARTAGLLGDREFYGIQCLLTLSLYSDRTRCTRVRRGIIYFSLIEKLIIPLRPAALSKLVMASTSSEQAQSATPADAALPLFARGVLSLLTIWPALRLCITHGWSNKSSTLSSALEKRTALAEELVDAYYSSYTSGTSAKGPETSEIEDFLIEYVEAEFGVGVEDGSENRLARDMEALWKECLSRATGQGTSSEGLLERFEALAQKAREEDGDPTKAFRATKLPGADDDDSDSDDGDDGEEEWGGMDTDMAPAQPAPRQREEPQVDEDGFTMVPSKGKRGGR